MLLLAWQTLRRQPRRFANAAAAVVASVMLVVSFDGLYLGIQRAMLTYLRTLPGDLVVAEGTASLNLLQSSTRVPNAVLPVVRATAGVARVEELHGRPAWIESAGRESLVYLVGISTESDFGLPTHIVAGRARPALAEIVVDRVLAHDLGVWLGDAIKVGGATLRIVGIASGGNSVIGSYAFVARGLLVLSGVQQPSYLFVTAAPGVDLGTLAAHLTEHGGLQAIPRATFTAKNQALTRQIFLPILAILDVVVAIVGGANTAVALHTSTTERREEYGLLAALGVPAGQIRRLVFVQAALASAVSVLFGLAGALLLSVLIPMVEPRFEIVLPLWLVAAGGGAALVVGLVAAVRAVRFVGRIEPALVFRV